MLNKGSSIGILMRLPFQLLNSHFHLPLILQFILDLYLLLISCYPFVFYLLPTSPFFVLTLIMQLPLPFLSIEIFRLQKIKLQLNFWQYLLDKYFELFKAPKRDGLSLFPIISQSKVFYFFPLLYCQFLPLSYNR